MVTLEEARERIGRHVLYRPAWMKPEEAEVGKVSSVNETYVFVSYRGGQPAATYPQDLHWEAP